MFDLISQVVIVLTGAAAIWLVNRPEKWSRWGSIVGIVGQPFWLWTTWTNAQWGMLALSVWYTYAWGQGVYVFWIRRS